jgi:hypothetical protein
VSQTDDRERVGSVAEEAAKLLGALSGWAKEHGDGLTEGLTDGLSDGWSSIADELHEHVATGAPECTWCPICRAVGVLRQTSPEVRAHLASAASSLMLAVSGMMTTHPPASDERVQRIDLDDDWPEDL